MTKCNHIARACSASVLTLLASQVNAADWTSTASVTPGATYTDNVCLSADDEKSEWIGLLTPAGSIKADGNRANLNIRGAVEMNTLSDSRLENLGCRGGVFGDRKQFAPRLNGNADAVLVEDWFYIDSTARISQNDVTPFASGGGDSLNRTGNTNTTYAYTVSPYLQRRFKDTAQLNLRYTWDDQYNTEDVVGDNTEQRVRGVLGGVPNTSPLTWGIEGNYSEVDYSDRSSRASGQDSELKSAQINLGYQLNRSWQVNGYYGEEWNDFVSTRDDIDGDYWDVGVRWTPTERTSVEVGTGDRFFGSTPRFAITHRHKRSTFRADYAETLTYSRNIRTLDDSTPDFDPTGTSLSTSPILDQRFTLGYSYQGRRSNLGLRAYQSDQTRTDNQRDSTYTGISANASRRLSRKTSLTANASWSEEDPKNSLDGQFSSSETWRGGLGLTHRLNQGLRLGFNYRYTDRQSDNEFGGQGFNEYTENRFTLDLTIDL